MKFIDVHCHLDDRYFEDSDRLFAELERRGVEKVITCGVDLQTSVAVKEIAEKYRGCYFTVGFHPTELQNYCEGDLEKIAELARHEK